MTRCLSTNQCGAWSRSKASRNSTLVSRRVHDEIQRYRVEVDGVTGGGASDVPLATNEIVYVPERVF